MSNLRFEYPDKDGNIQVVYIDEEEWRFMVAFRASRTIDWEKVKRERRENAIKFLNAKYPLTPNECIETKPE